MTIRAATEADIPAITRAHVASWRETYRGIVPQAFLDGIKLDEWEARRRKNQAQPGNHTLVAETEPGIVGFTIGGKNRDSAFAFDAELYAIYVLRAHQGRGLGRALQRALVERLAADGHRSMILWVLRDNPSRAFYERLGGQLAGEKEIEIGGAKLVEVAYGWSVTIPPSAS
jgi:ribosomal protein S18 acetylase RimI-like enzyme